MSNRPQLTKLKKQDFSTEEYERLEDFIRSKMKYMKDTTMEFRTVTYPKWIKMYKGIPNQAVKSLPWEGASNLVIQLIGTFSDELLARVMGTIYNNEPLYVAQISAADAGKEDAVAEKQVLEDFIQRQALDPNELDLYRVEQMTFASAIKYGAGVVYAPHEYVTEVAAPLLNGDESYSQMLESNEIVVKDGPSPQMIPLNRVMLDFKEANIDKQQFIVIIKTYDWWGVENLKAHGEDMYDHEEIDAVLGSPTRLGPDEAEQMEGELKGITGASAEKASYEYDIWLGMFKYTLPNGKTYSLFAQYYDKTDTVLLCYYNPMPDNMLPVELAKLAYDDTNALGTGFCEMLSSYQKEVSKSHNWRQDCKDFAQTPMFRVSKDSKLASILNIHPGMLIPADEGEIEAIGTDGGVNMNTDDEELTLRLAAARAGVDPATGGSGGGTVNAKRGVYSAMGTSLVMANQNNRNNLRTSDMRGAHVRLGIKLLKMYAAFGIPQSTLLSYGEKSSILTSAFRSFKDKKLGLLLRGSSPTLNSELEKQNDILLNNTLTATNNQAAQLIMALTQQKDQMAPELRSYYLDNLEAMGTFAASLLRSFGKIDVNKLLPVLKTVKILRSQFNAEQQQRNQQQNQGRGSGGAGNSMGGLVPTGGQSAAAIPVGGGDEASSVSEGVR
jgi:hypothetical protein